MATVLVLVVSVVVTVWLVPSLRDARKAARRVRKRAEEALLVWVAVAAVLLFAVSRVGG